jgi:peptide/nickel transport system permease protein
MALARLAAVPLSPAGPRRTAFARRLRRNWAVLLGGALVGALLLSALLAPALAPHRPTDIFGGRELEPPSRAFPFGTDDLGRDLLSRVLYGARVSLAVASGAVAVAGVVGTGAGVAMGYAGGLVDLIGMRVFDILLAFPAILLAVAVVAVLGPSTLDLILTIGALTAPQFALLMRSAALGARGQEYVQAARALGAGDARIIRRHVLPNVAAPFIVQASLSLSIVVLVEASLSFLGLGTQPPAPSWGGMLSRGREHMVIAPWLVIGPGAAIMAAVLGFNLLGDGLRDVLDPRGSGRGAT